MAGAASTSRQHAQYAPSVASEHGLPPPRKPSFSSPLPSPKLMTRGIREGSPQDGSCTPTTPTFHPNAPFRYDSVCPSPKSATSSIRRNISGPITISRPILHNSPSSSSLRPSISSSTGFDPPSGPSTGNGMTGSPRWPSSGQRLHRPSPSMPLTSSGWTPSPRSSSDRSFTPHKAQVCTPQPPSPLPRSASDSFGSNPTPKLQRKKSSASLLVGGIGRGLGRAASVIRKNNNNNNNNAESAAVAYASGHVQSQSRSLGPTWGRKKRNGSMTLDDLCEDEDESAPPPSRTVRARQESGRGKLPPGWVGPTATTSKPLPMRPGTIMLPETSMNSHEPSSSTSASGVSLPFNVQHELHVSADLDGMPNDWLETLKAQGLSDSDLLLITAAQRKQRNVKMIPVGQKQNTMATIAAPTAASTPPTAPLPSATAPAPAPAPARTRAPKPMKSTSAQSAPAPAESSAPVPPPLHAAPVPQLKGRETSTPAAPAPATEPAGPPPDTTSGGAPSEHVALVLQPRHNHSRPCSAADATIVTVTGAAIKRKPSIISKLLDDLDSVSSRPSRPGTRPSMRSRSRSSSRGTKQTATVVPPVTLKEQQPAAGVAEIQTQHLSMEALLSQLSLVTHPSAQSSAVSLVLPGRRISVDLRGFRELEINGEDGWASSVLAAWDEDSSLALSRTRTAATPARQVSQRAQRIPAPIDAAATQPLAPSYGVALTPTVANEFAKEQLQQQQQSPQQQEELAASPAAVTGPPGARKAIPFYDTPSNAASGSSIHLLQSSTSAAGSQRDSSDMTEIIPRRRSKSFDFDPAIRATILSPPPPPRPAGAGGSRVMSTYDETGSTVSLDMVSAAPIIRGDVHRRNSVDSFGVAHSGSSTSSRSPSSSELDLGTPPLDPPETTPHTAPEKERTPPGPPPRQDSLASTIVSQTLPHTRGNGVALYDGVPPDSPNSISVATSDDDYDEPASGELSPFPAAPMRQPPAHRHQHLSHLQFPVSASSLNLNSPPFPSHPGPSSEDGEDSASAFGSSFNAHQPTVSALGLCLTLAEPSANRLSGSSALRLLDEERHDRDRERERDVRGSMLSRMSSVASSTNSYSTHEVTVHRAYTRVLRRVAEGTETPANETASSSAASDGGAAGAAMGALEEAAWRVALRERVATN